MTESTEEIRLSHDLPDAGMSRFSLLNEQMILISLIRTGTGKNIVSLKMAGSFPYSEDMIGFIGIPPEPSESNLLVFSRNDVTLPFVTQNNIMISYLEPELKRRLDELSKEKSFIDLLRRTLFTAIPGGRFSREETAQALGLSVRSMQRKLFCSWVLKDDHHQILESSDTGYGGHFEEIHRRFGDFDLFMPDSGQYNINWHYWHMFPEESVMAAETLGAKTVMPIHWGAFVLSGHGWDDSPERVTLGCEEKGIQVISPKLCETMVLDKCENYHERWWREYN